MRKAGMETKKEQQFARWSHEMTCAKEKFENRVVAFAVTVFVTVILLLVDFYQIPYVLSGIRPYVIHLGLVLLPIFGVGIFIHWEKAKKAEAAYEDARIALIRDIQSREIE